MSKRLKSSKKKPCPSTTSVSSSQSALPGTLQSLLPGEKLKVAKLVQQVMQLRQENERLSAELQNEIHQKETLLNSQTHDVSISRNLVSLSTQTMEDVRASSWDAWIQATPQFSTISTETDHNLATQRNVATTAIDLVLVHRRETYAQTVPQYQPVILDDFTNTETIYCTEQGTSIEIELVEMGTNTEMITPQPEKLIPQSLPSSPEVSSVSSLQLSTSTSLGLSVLSDGDVDDLLHLISGLET
ncbi:hypothetical protein RCL1_000286 [Eukaryota sp. TZLM3-RCL]